jgi:hypothetical protein
LARIDGLAGLFACLDDVAPPAGLAVRVMAAATAHPLPEPSRRWAATRSAEWNPLHWWLEATRTLRWATATLVMAGLAIGAVIGQHAATSSAEAPAGPSDPLAAYAVDYLADSPDGSLAGSYLALLEFPGEGR